MNKKKSLISPKYTNLNLLTEEEKKHKFPTQEGDVNQVQFTLLRYLPLAKIFTL